MGNSTETFNSYLPSKPQLWLSGTFSGGTEQIFKDFPSKNIRFMNFCFWNLAPDSNNRQFYMRTSSNGGASFDNGGNDYSYATRYIFVASNGYITNANNNLMRPLFSSMGHDANERNCLNIMMFYPSEGKYTKFISNCVGVDVSTLLGMGYGGLIREQAGIVNAVRFYVSGGNFGTDVGYAFHYL